MSGNRAKRALWALGCVLAVGGPWVAAPAQAQGRYEGTTEAQKLLKQAERLEGEAASLKASRPDEAQDRYEDALSKCEEALEADPEFLDAYVRLGYLYYALGRNQDGAERLAEAMGRWPEQGRLQRVYGTVLFDLPGRRAESVKLLEAAGKADPEQFDVWFLLGKHYYEAGAWADGARVLRRYLALKPDDVQVHGTLGNIYLKTEKLEPALAEFRLVLSLEPSNLSAQINIANILFKQGSHEESAKLLEQVLAVDPRQHGARFNLASCRYEQGRYEDAIAQWRLFLEGQPGHATASYMIGASLAELERWGEARAAFAELARRKPDHAKARWRLALLDLREGKLDEARKRADEALKLAPKDSAILGTAGDVRRRLGDPEAALELHEQGLALGPSAALYASKGRDLYALGRLDEGAESLEQAVAQGGGDGAKDALAVVLLARARRALAGGDLAAAGRDAQRLEQLGARPVGLRLLRSALDVAGGDLEGARARLDEAERLAQGMGCAPADCPRREVLAAKGRLALRAGDFEGARGRLEALLEGGTTQDAELANDLGRANAGLGAWDKALEWFVLARDKGMDPQRAERNVALAAIHLSEQLGEGGQWREALEVLESAERLRGRLSEGDQVVLDLAWGTAWAEAGSAPKALGRLKAAEQRLRQLSPQERAGLPSAELLELRQAYLLHRLGQDDKALALLERLNLKAMPQGGRLMLAVCTGLAEKQWGAGKVGAAREFLRKAQPYAPNDPWLQHNLAVLEYAEGKKVGEVFGKVAGRVPEGLYNQAIYLDDVVGDERGAYELYRKLQGKAGALGERAREKADSKARVFGLSEVAMLRWAWGVVCAGCVLGWCTGAWAQEGRVYTVALYAPGLDFGDGVAKAGFVERAAQALSQRTGLPCRGVAFARAEDLQAQAKEQKIDFAILGGDFYAASGLGKPLAWASGSAPLALVARPGEAGSLARLKGKTLILPPPGAAYEGFVTSTALDHEAKAKNFFKIKYTKDVESAVAAVNLGQADLTVALEPYALRSGLSVVYRVQGAGPLPVAVQLNEGLEPEVAKVFAGAFSGLGVEGPGGLFQGFGGGGEGVKLFRGYANGKAEAARPVMAPVPRVKLELGGQGADPTGVLDGGGAEGLVPAPAMPE